MMIPWILWTPCTVSRLFLLSLAHGPMGPIWYIICRMSYLILWETGENDEFWRYKYSENAMAIERKSWFS